MKEEKILSLLRERREDKALRVLYAYSPKIEKLILSMGGSKPDAEDVFQEALIVFCKKAQQPDFVLTAAIGTYLYATSKNIWLHSLRKRGKEAQSMENLPEQFISNDELIEEDERAVFARRAMASLGARCKELFEHFYFQKLSMSHISELMGYASDKAARNQKYKCMERAKASYQAQLSSVNLQNDKIHV